MKAPKLGVAGIKSGGMGKSGRSVGAYTAPISGPKVSRAPLGRGIGRPISLGAGAGAAPRGLAGGGGAMNGGSAGQGSPLPLGSMKKGGEAKKSGDYRLHKGERVTGRSAKARGGSR